jgi:hypothetical protein
MYSYLTLVEKEPVWSLELMKESEEYELSFTPWEPNCPQLCHQFSRSRTQICINSMKNQVDFKYCSPDEPIREPSPGQPTTSAVGRGTLRKTLGDSC